MLRAAEMEGAGYKAMPSRFKVYYLFHRGCKNEIKWLIGEGAFSTNVNLLRCQGFNLYFRCFFLLLGNELPIHFSVCFLLEFSRSAELI